MQTIYTNRTTSWLQWRWLSLVLLVLASGWGRGAQAQTWQQAISGASSSTGGGTSAPKTTAIDASGNVLVMGTFSGTVAFGGTALVSAGDSDIFLAKWNPTTATWVWAVRAGGTGSDFGGGVAVNGASVYLTGTIWSGANAVVSGTSLNGAGGQDIVLAKYTDNGSTVSNGWAVSAGGSANDYSNGVAVSGSSVYIAGVYVSGTGAVIAGTSLTGLGADEAYVAKYTDNGSSATNGWATSAGGIYNDYINGLTVSGSSVYVTGLYTSFSNASIGGQLFNGTGSWDMFVAKYTDNGSTFTNGWVISNGGTADDLGYGVAVNGSNVYVAGFFTSSAGAVISGQSLNGVGGSDVFVAKYTDNGSTFANGWARSSGGFANDRCDGIAVNGSNVYVSGRFLSGTGAVFAGTSLTGQGDLDAMVFRYVDNGSTPTAGTAVSAGGTGTDIGYTVAANASNVYATVATGATPATFGSFTAPANTAVVGKLGAGSAFGAWQQVAYPITLSTGGETWDAALDASGNVLVTGAFSGLQTFGSTQLVSAGGSDMFIAKWNPTTSTWMWAVRAGGPGNESGRSIVVSNGSVYVAGEFASTTGVVLAGTTLAGAGGQDAFLAKYTDAGSSVTGAWAVSGGGTSDDYGKEVAVNGTDVYLASDFVSNTSARFAGITLPGAGLTDFVLARYTDNGSTVANGGAVANGGTQEDYVNGLAINGSNIYVTGIFLSGANAQIAGRSLPGVGSYDAYLAKFTPQGSTVAGVWAVSGGGTSNDLAQEVTVNGSAVYVAGAFRSNTAASFAGTALTGAGGQDIVLAKYIDNGTTVSNGWARSGGGTTDDYGYGVAVSGTSVYITGKYTSATALVAGATLTNAGDNDLFVGAYTDAGSSATNLWANSGGGTGFDQGETIVAGAGGAVYVGGQTTPVASFGGLSLNTPVGTPVDFLGRLGVEAVAITALSPTHGVAGTAVSISGTGLGSTTSVSFNGVAAASFAVNSPTSVTAVVPVGAATGPVSLNTSTGSSASSTSSFTVDQPSATRLLLDGYREARYGTALALQTTPTGFGNATNGSPTNAIGGSELDAAYAQVRGDSVYVFLAGNIENNDNVVEVFFDSQTGGQNVLTSTNPSVDNNGLNAMAGLGFDTGFAADYYLSVRGLSSGGVAQAYFASLGAAGTGISPASTGTGQVMSLNLGSGRSGTLAVDNSNTGGINDATVGTGVPAAVVTGLEFVLPLAALGTPTGTLRVSTFVNGGGHNYLSNQALGGLPNGTGNLASPTGVSFATLAGNQYFTISFPRATSLSPSSGPVGTSVTLTGANLTGATSISFTSGSSTIVLTSGFVVNAAGTQITGIVVPNGATTGLVTVTTPGGISNGVVFTVTVTPLSLTSISPSSGAVGTSVTLTGTGLTGTTSISFAGTSGNVVTSGFTVNTTGTQITSVVVPSGATTGLVTVTTASGTSNGVTFTVNMPPVISSFTPSSGGTGTTVTISGSGFVSGGTTVTLNGVSIGGIVVNGSGTSLTFTVPTGAIGGPITVTTAFGTATSAGPFCVPYVATTTGASRCGAGTVTLTASGAPTGGSYAWYTAATGGTAISGATTASYLTPSLSTTTTYYVSIVTGSGTTACEGARTAATATINAVPVVTITAGGPISFCAGGNVTLTASGASTYLWSTGATTASIVVSTGGSYSVTGTSTAGCPATSAATTVTVNPLPTAPATTAASRCGPGAVTLTATGTPTGGSYAWYTTATGGTAIAGATTASYTTPSLSITTTYYVSALSASSCEGPRTAVTATINAVPTVSIAANGPLTFCAGGSVTLTASGAATYLWSTGATTASITVSTTGSYTVTGTSTAGCPATSAATTVTVNPLPTAPVTTAASRCGAGSVTLTATGTPTGGSYAWYSTATGGTAISGATTGSYTTPSLAATTTYYVSALSASSCEGPRTAVVATINTVPTVSIAVNGPLTFCAGGTVTLTASGADTYLWSTGATTASITVSTAGSYTVTGTSTAGCSATSAATTVTVNPLPAAPTTTPAALCGPGAVTLAASGAPTGGSYLWYTTATGGSAIAGATTASYLTPSLSATTTYYVSAVSATGCEGPRAAVVATINAVPTVSVAATGATTFCAGGTVTLTASGADTYLWSTGATTASITVSTDGSYTVTGTSTAGCSATSAATTIVVSPLPPAPTTTPAALCGPGSLTLTASGAPAGSSYAWYEQATGGPAITGATTGSYTTPSLAATTTYYVSVVNASGCESPRTAVVATINAVPTVSIAATGPLTFCAGGTVTLTASGAATYLWSTGATTASITVSTTGSYTVTGTSTAGCAAPSAATAVTVEPLPATPVITQAPTGTLTSSSAVGNQWYVGGALIPGATAATYVVTSAAGNGTYTVVVTSATGCASAPSAAVTVVLTGTTPSALSAGLLLLPNPAHGSVTVQLPALAGSPSATLTLLDALGRTIRTQALTLPAAPSRHQLNLADLATGVYLVRVQSGSTTATRRLVVE